MYYRPSTAEYTHLCRKQRILVVMFQTLYELILTGSDVLAQLLGDAEPIRAAAPHRVIRHVTSRQTPHVCVALVEQLIKTLLLDEPASIERVMKDMESGTEWVMIQYEIVHVHIIPYMD